MKGARVVVLGLGRTGLSAARALAAGGAVPLCWDDSADVRANAEAQGLIVHDLSRREAWENVALMIVSPGIPHLYPQPNPWVAQAMSLGVPVDNDICLLYTSDAADE